MRNVLICIHHGRERVWIKMEIFANGFVVTFGIYLLLAVDLRGVSQQRGGWIKT